MKELLLQFSVYNTWANELLLGTITKLPEEKQHQEVPSSFTSLYKTVLHVWDAESIWWQRLKLQERIVPPSENFTGAMTEMVTGLLNQNRQWQEWINEAQERMLEHVFHYQNSKREQFKQPVYQMLLHLFNHGTYHRGQLVNMLRQLEVSPVPQTDFIVWSRRKK
ncbi:MAG: DinB family protein [Bacteroidota bacterium]|nr:DinB family protein [Bacteroidota bacterium]